MTKKRIAVQLCGNLRTFKKTFDSFKKNIVIANENAGYTVDVFMHVWDQMEHSSKTWHNKNAELKSMKISEADLSFITENYKPVKILIEDNSIMNLKENPSFKRFTGFSSDLKTVKSCFYTKYKVNELRNIYEAENDISYDLVLNSRPDIFYKEELVLSDWEERYIKTFNNYDSIEDKMFFGSANYKAEYFNSEKLLSASDIIYFARPKSMDKVADYYNCIKESDLRDKFFSFEYLLINHVKNSLLEPVKISYKVGSEWIILRNNAKIPGQFKAKISKLLSFVNKYKKV